MSATTCYAMVRGSTLRVTGLTADGRIPSPVTYAVSKAVVRVSIDEVVEEQRDETLRDEIDRPRVRFTGNDDVLAHAARAEFLRVDPGLIALMTSLPEALDDSDSGIGFDAQTRLPVASFALEVWSTLDGPVCADGQKWGYTLFPHLRGGYLSGFQFENRLTTFSLNGATSQRGPLWRVGPYDLHDVWERLVEPVSGNDSWVQTILDTPPPAQTDGVVTFVDSVRNGTAANPMPDPGAPVRLIGGTASSTSDWIVSGGRA